MTYSIIEVIGTLFGCILVTQFSYGFLIFLLESTMTDFYALGIYQPPRNFFQKTTNLFMLITIGFGYHIYLILRNYNWFVRKFLFLIALVLQGIASLIIYYIVYGILKAIFL